MLEIYISININYINKYSKRELHCETDKINKYKVQIVFPLIKLLYLFTLYFSLKRKYCSQITVKNKLN